MSLTKELTNPCQKKSRKARGGSGTCPMRKKRTEENGFEKKNTGGEHGKLLGDWDFLKDG